MYLYVISSDTAVKIGYAKCPEKRLVQLQTGHQDTLKLCYKTEVPEDQVKLLEQTVHKMNRHRKIKGEWFNLSPTEAEQEIEHTLIKYLKTDL